jgi:hypothetical protein
VSRAALAARSPLSEPIQGHFDAMEITGADFDRIEIIGDLIRPIEIVDDER